MKQAISIILMFLVACGRQSDPIDVNVILISVDTLRADRLNCYGFDRHPLSPHIDALASDGVLFENHISSSPWTTPSHMSMVTGMYPSSHGVIQSFGELMRGLHGGTFNKLPEARLTLAEVLSDEGCVTAAFTGGGTLDPKIGFDQGFSLYDTCMYKLNDRNMETMIDWIRAHTTNRFFLFWHTFEAHAPYVHADFLPEAFSGLRNDYEKLVKDMDSAAAELGSHQGYNAAIMKFLQSRGAFTREVCESLYLGGIRSMDARLGAMVAALRRDGLYDRSLIVFTSDHGEEFADHHSQLYYDRHGHSVFDEMIRVPLIIKLPRRQHAGVRVNSVTRGVDIMPTILDVLDITPAIDEMQGDSLVPLWQGATAPPRVAFTEGAAFDVEIKSLRSNRYKYILNVAAEVVRAHGRSHLPEGKDVVAELYDLQADPGEKQNLMSGGDESVKQLGAELDRRLRAIVSAQKGETDEVELDENTLRRLKSLGYLD